MKSMALLAALFSLCSPSQQELEEAATGWAQSLPIPHLIHVTCVEPDPDLDRTLCTFWRQSFHPLDAECNLDDCGELRESRNPFPP